MVLFFQPNQLMDKYWQMVGGSYTVDKNHKKCWLELKMCLCFNLYVLIRRITHYHVYEILYVLFLWSFKFMKFYVEYFLFLLVLWVKMWQNECVEPLNIWIFILKPCRFNKHLEFTRDVKWVIFFLFFPL